MRSRCLARLAPLCLAPLVACGGGDEATTCTPSGTTGGGVVVTARGTVQGDPTGSGGYAFRGVRYAAAPSGERRFSPPGPPPCAKGVIDGSRPGPLCPQLDASGNAVGDEDCLRVDVFTPDEPAGEGPRHPVVVFLPGGGHAEGGPQATVSDVAIYDGEHLSKLGGLVVVTVSSRLGALGWLAHPDLNATGPMGSSGNYGLLDQQAALDWVKTNIAAFGGDPARVLLAGQGSGATDVCMHLAAPGSAGRFSAALLSSGGCDAPRMADALRQGVRIAEKVGCTGDGAAACLRRVPTANLVEAAPARTVVTGLEQGERFGPNIDGEVLPQAPLQTIATGAHARVPVIVGGTATEAGRAAPNVRDSAGLNELLTQLFGAYANEVAQEYPLAGYPSARAAFVALSTEGRYLCPARRIARALVAHAPVYRYVFSRALAGAQADLGAYHGLDALFLFRRFAVGGYAPTSGDNATADTLIGAVSSFVTSGDPGGAGAAWPAYDGTRDPALDVGTTASSIEGVSTMRCDFWDEFERKLAQ